MKIWVEGQRDKILINNGVGLIGEEDTYYKGYEVTVLKILRAWNVCITRTSDKKKSHRMTR